MKVPVRKLQLYSPQAVYRYLLLKDAVLEGVISNLRIEHDSDGAYGFGYRILWTGEFMPTGISLTTLRFWRTLVARLGRGVRVIEPIRREQYANQTDFI